MADQGQGEGQGGAPPSRLFDGFPEPMEARIVAFDADKACGFVVKWAKKGVGFGEVTLSMDKTTGEWRADTECMGPHFIAEVFRAITGGMRWRKIV